MCLKSVESFNTVNNLILMRTSLLCNFSNKDHANDTVMMYLEIDYSQ